MKRFGGSVLAAAMLLSACTAAPHPSSSPGASTPTTATTPDYGSPAAARDVLTKLQQASGQPDAIKVELTRTSATVAVVDNGTAKTWTWRDGKAEQVDGDTQYVGQARFRLTDFALDDVDSLFRQAAKLSGSTSNQQLQIVDYSAGKVYMTVTTSPESQTVFFTPSGSVIPPLDLTTRDGIASGLTDAVDGRVSVYAIAISPTAGVSVDSASGQADSPLLRSIRAPKFPTRVELRTDKPVSSLPFSPSDVSPDVLAQLTARYRGPNSAPVTFAIDRRDGLADATIHVSADGRTIICDLAGNDITAVVKR